jgi:hypothetical protein
MHEDSQEKTFRYYLEYAGEIGMMILTIVGFFLNLIFVGLTKVIWSILSNAYGRFISFAGWAVFIGVLYYVWSLLSPSI